MKQNARQIMCRTSHFPLERQTAQDICWLLHLPLFTFRLPFAVSFPKTFSASQLYSPASSSFTLLNCSLEIFLLKSTAEISYWVANHPGELIIIPGPGRLPGIHPFWRGRAAWPHQLNTHSSLARIRMTGITTTTISYMNISP